MAHMDYFGLQHELELVERELLLSIRSQEDTISEICSHVVGAGGKRIRPALLFLAYRVSGGEDTESLVKLAVAVELIHTATLIHDDINDSGMLRRGRESASSLFGESKALIAGDYLFAVGFGLAGEYGQEVIELTSRTGIGLAETEIRQSRNRMNLLLTVPEYTELIQGKTAAVFSDGASLGARLAGADETTMNTLASFGNHVGLAFQITDDILDIIGSCEELGKKPGADLLQGTITLPIILGLELLKGREREYLIGALGSQSQDESIVAHVRELLEKTGAIQGARQTAIYHKDTALDILSGLTDSAHNQWKDGMARYADYVVSRCC